MSRPRVATLGRPGPTWPRAVARWGSTGTLALEATTCVTPEELLALVRTAPVDLAVVDSGLPGVDHAFAEAIRAAGTTVAVVGGPGLADAARRLPADAVLTDEFDVDALAAVLRARPPRPAVPAPAVVAAVELGPLVVVTGPGGTGASTVSQALATVVGSTRATVLADLDLDGDQHVRHGAPPDGEGLFELGEALRAAGEDEVVAPLAPQPGGYALLRGLRRRQEWTVLDRDRAERVVRVLRRGAAVVADVGPDLDGRADTGSADLEDRNGLARAAVDAADRVVVVGRWSTTGAHRLARLLTDLVRHGVEPRRLHPVVNAVGGGGARRRTTAVATGRLLDDVLTGADLPAPVVLPHDRRLEACLRDGRPLPRRFVRAVAGGIPWP